MMISSLLLAARCSGGGNEPKCLSSYIISAIPSRPVPSSCFTDSLELRYISSKQQQQQRSGCGRERPFLSEHFESSTSPDWRWRTAINLSVTLFQESTTRPVTQWKKEMVHSFQAEPSRPSCSCEYSRRSRCRRRSAQYRQQQGQTWLSDTPNLDRRTLLPAKHWRRNRKRRESGSRCHREFYSEFMFYIPLPFWMMRGILNLTMDGYGFCIISRDIFFLDSNFFRTSILSGKGRLNWESLSSI